MNVVSFRDLSREQRIAHLELHGWCPVREGKRDPRCYRGIFCASLEVGFAVSLSYAGARVIILHQGDNFVETHWNDVIDSDLDAIDARLAEV